VNYHHPDLSGKIVIITGANSGLGEASAGEILKLKPKRIIMACRNQKKAMKSIIKVS